MIQNDQIVAKQQKQIETLRRALELDEARRAQEIQAVNQAIRAGFTVLRAGVDSACADAFARAAANLGFCPTCERRPCLCEGENL